MLEPRFLTFLRFDSEPPSSSSSSSLFSESDDSVLSTIKHKKIPQHNHKIHHIISYKVHVRATITLHEMINKIKGYVTNTNDLVN